MAIYWGKAFSEMFIVLVNFAHWNVAEVIPLDFPYVKSFPHRVQLFVMDS
jgi:hypothetical protein